MLDDHGDIEASIAAHVGSWLDGARDRYDRGFDIRTFAVVFETVFPPEDDSGYPDSQIGFTCSDERNWIQAALFRRAMLIAEREGLEPEADLNTQEDA